MHTNRIPVHDTVLLPRYGSKIASTMPVYEPVFGPKAYNPEEVGLTQLILALSKLLIMSRRLQSSIYREHRIYLGVLIRFKYP